MKPIRSLLVLLALAAVAVAIGPTLVGAAPDEARADGTPAVEGSGTEAATDAAQEPQPQGIDPIPRGCQVSRDCQYPPPASISCESVFRDCSQGSEGYGWVECDGVRQYCSAPSCGGTGTPCSKDSHCYEPGVCTCGQGVCTAGACVCPENPVP